MKHKLIMLLNPILVSDEEIKLKDFAINTMLNQVGEVVYITHHKVIDDLMIKTKEFDHLSSRNNNLKIIAGHANLPSFRFADGVRETIGIHGVHLIAEKKYPIVVCHEQDINHWDRNNFIEGFEAAQSLQKYMFSEDDILSLLTYISKYTHIDYSHVRRWNLSKLVATDTDIKDCWVKSRTPKIYEVELEMESVWEEGINSDETECSRQPKLTNNSYTITKIIK